MNTAELSEGCASPCIISCMINLLRKFMHHLSNSAVRFVQTHNGGFVGKKLSFCHFLINIFH